MEFIDRQPESQFLFDWRRFRNFPGVVRRGAFFDWWSVLTRLHGQCFDEERPLRGERGKPRAQLDLAQQRLEDEGECRQIGKMPSSRHSITTFCDRLDSSTALSFAPRLTFEPMRACGQTVGFLLCYAVASNEGGASTTSRGTSWVAVNRDTPARDILASATGLAWHGVAAWAARGR